MALVTTRIRQLPSGDYEVRRYVGSFQWAVLGIVHGTYSDAVEACRYLGRASRAAEHRARV